MNVDRVGASAAEIPAYAPNAGSSVIDDVR
jgi:hypothetical protein